MLQSIIHMLQSIIHLKLFSLLIVGNVTILNLIKLYKSRERLGQTKALHAFTS